MVIGALVLMGLIAKGFGWATIGVVALGALRFAYCLGRAVSDERHGLGDTPIDRHVKWVRRLHLERGQLRGRTFADILIAERSELAGLIDPGPLYARACARLVHARLVRGEPSPEEAVTEDDRGAIADFNGWFRDANLRGLLIPMGSMGYERWALAPDGRAVLARLMDIQGATPSVEP